MSTAWVLPAEPVAPFGDAPGTLPWLEDTLAEGRRRRLTRIGFSGAPATGPLRGPGLVLRDDLAVNESALRRFLETARAGAGRGRLVLAGSAFTRNIGVPDDLALPLYLLGDEDLEAGDLDELPAVRVETETREFPIDDGLTLPVPRHFALDVSDWSRLLWANLYGMASEVLSAPRSTGLAFVLRALLRARSLNPDRIAAGATVLGKGARIHPSAVVEASILGPGARVGAHACVRGSILGEGAAVEPLAEVTASVIAGGARVQRQAMVRFSLLFPEAAVGGTVQLSVFGRGSRLHGGSYAMDMPLDGSAVEIRVDGSARTAGMALGGCLGHGAIVGSGVWIAPGRALPNGIVVLRDPEHVVRRIPTDVRPGVVHVVRDGALVPLRRDG